MKRLLAGLLVCLGGALLFPTEARCSDCLSKVCVYDAQCGASCSCVKRQGNITGKCI